MNRILNTQSNSWGTPALDKRELFSYNRNMTTLTTIDPTGRIVLPKSVLESLNLVPGDSMELSASNGEITLRPIRTSSPLVQEMGVWVYRSGATPSIDVLQIIDEVREERICDLAK